MGSTSLLGYLVYIHSGTDGSLNCAQLLHAPSRFVPCAPIKISVNVCNIVSCHILQILIDAFQFHILTHWIECGTKPPPPHNAHVKYSGLFQLPPALISNLFHLALIRQVAP